MTRYKLITTYKSGTDSYPTFVDTLEEAQEWENDIRSAGLTPRVTRVEITETPLPESDDHTALPACFAWDAWPIWNHIPGHLRPGLWHYFTEHRPTGDFLRAVLAVNFSDALLRLDYSTPLDGLRALAHLVRMAPPGSVGSYAAVDVWTGKGGDLAEALGVAE